jgi:hypothetical protein
MRGSPRFTLLVSLLALLATGALLGFLLGARPAAAAKRPEAEQAKIDWLVSEIQRSDATFVRNGSAYDGTKAASHLRSKLLFAGKRVQTARDFIAGICTRSETSGKPYEIRPRGEASRPLADWLLERLNQLEARPTVSATPAR